MTNTAILPTRRHSTNYGDEFVSEEKSSFVSSRVRVTKRVALSDSDRVPEYKCFGRFQGSRLGDVPMWRLRSWFEHSEYWINAKYPNVWSYIKSAVEADDKDCDRAERNRY